ncbi:UNVERIFIED_CONTAM: hypothetical protein FKN15_029937 [Acipenser sinensis]
MGIYLFKTQNLNKYIKAARRACDTVMSLPRGQDINELHTDLIVIFPSSLLQSWMQRP